MDFALIIDTLPKLLQSVPVTIELLFLSVFIGSIVGLICSQLLLHPNKLVRAIPFGYVTFFRGTPLLVQIFLIYYGLGQFEIIRTSILWNVLREPYWCALIAFTLNTAAYLSEIMRGGFSNIPNGEIEAAESMGFNKLQLFVKIKFVRMLHQILPTYTNEVIFMLKGTALASTITILDITGVARTIVAQTYAPIEIFISAGILYLCISLVLIGGFRLLDKQLTAPFKFNR